MVDPEPIEATAENQTITMQLKFDWLIVLENLRRGIMVTDVTLEAPSGPRIIYVNRAWLKMTGYSRDETQRENPAHPAGQAHQPRGGQLAEAEVA